MRLLVACTVPGHPATKGSLRGRCVKHGAPVVMFEDHKSSKPWRILTAQALRHYRIADEPYPGPVQVTLRFIMPRPANPASDWAIGHQVGDLDKLVRNVLDAATDAEVWKDDSQVCQMVTEKQFAEIGQAAGLHVAIFALEA